MATLQVYEMLVKKPAKEITKASTVTDELPDESNLAIIDGILCLVDGHNDTVVSVSTIVKELDSLTDKMFIANGSARDSIFALYNYFDQLNEEYS